MPSRFGPSIPLSITAEHCGIPAMVELVVDGDVVDVLALVVDASAPVVIASAVVDGPAEEVAVMVVVLVVVTVVVTTVVVTVDVVVLAIAPVVVGSVFVVTVFVLVVSVLVVVDVVEVRVVVLGPGGMGLNPPSSTVVVVLVIIVVVVVEAQVLKFSVSSPHAVRKPPNTMRESSAAEASSKM